MKEDIYNIPLQLKERFSITNNEKWEKRQGYVLAGMGGSHLQGDILKAVLPNFPIEIHCDYGLPQNISDGTGIIVASYSGNTEEAISSLEESLSRGLSCIVISKGGKMIDMAVENNTPYIKLPDNNIQPRMAVGYSFKALLKALFLESLEVDAVTLADKLYCDKEVTRERGEILAKKLEEMMPVIYSSSGNKTLSSIFKINFNETTKIPSFYNTIPELNHNEMTGLDVVPMSKHLSSYLKVLLLQDKSDALVIQKRMSVLKTVLESRGISTCEIEIEGDSRLEKVFRGIILSAWTSFFLSFYYKTDPDEVPMVEEFKKLITEQI